VRTTKKLLNHKLKTVDYKRMTVEHKHMKVDQRHIRFKFVITHSCIVEIIPYNMLKGQLQLRTLMGRAGEVELLSHCMLFYARLHARSKAPYHLRHT
jgi:hypothetical protein